MFKTNEQLTTMDMYELCNANNWFTCGSICQYEKMFEYVREANIYRPEIDEDKIQKLATIIWICSDNIDEKEIFKTIQKKVCEIKNGCLYC